MKAVVFEQHGGVEVLKYREVAEPDVSPNDVLLRVRAAACNYNDIWARRGMPGMSVIFPHISGSDVAGEVVKAGSEVHNVKPGDEVVVHCGVSCRHCEACASGEDVFCREFRIWGFQTGPLDGGHSELVRVPAYNVIPKPKNLTWEEAASLPLVLVTAWRKLVTRARVKPGDYVLVWGAAGGLGMMALQIARLFKAQPIAVASSDEKLRACEKLGAEALINRKTQDVQEEVRSITGRRGVDIVFEHPGMATWPTSVLTVRRGGTIVTSGATSGHEGTTDLRHVFFRQLNVLGSTLGSKAELIQAMRFVETGDIKPVVSEVLPLKDVGRAQLSMEGSDVVGKIVLVPDGNGSH
jgi:NADPH:quinone reductase-like Zn-dependent oxidoreductase